MYVAEADGNRTRLRACALTSVLKTAGPTRNPDASGRSLSTRGDRESVEQRLHMVAYPNEPGALNVAVHAELKLPVPLAIGGEHIQGREVGLAGVRVEVRDQAAGDALAHAHD